MSSARTRTFRYVGSWLGGRAKVMSRELTLDRGGTPVPATLLLPDGAQEPVPAWIVLHGITRPGRAHTQLVRFSRALAHSGFAVLVPEVPEWRMLDLAPGLTVPTVRACVHALRRLRNSIAPEPLGLVGFSFGAPQALAASGHPDLRADIGAAVGFGGYCDLERTVRFQFTGHHEWQGEAHHARPDPYGRWIVGANYLNAIPGLGDASSVATGLRKLASIAGDRGIMAWDEALDLDKAEIRAGLSSKHRELFDLFAPPSVREPEPAAATEMATALAEAGRRLHPDIEPVPFFRDIRCPVRLLHGRHDHLIPFTEGLRMHQALPASVDARVDVTRLFGHSAQDPLPGLRDGVPEVARFFRALKSILGAV